MIYTSVLAAFLEYSPNPTWLVDSDGRSVTSVEHLLEAVVADESPGTVVALAISVPSSRRKEIRSKRFGEKEE
jgi:hypothetical protein